MPAPIPNTFLSAGALGNSVTVDWTSLGIQTGDVLVLCIRSQGTIAADIAMPGGWQRAGTSGSLGTGDRFQAILYHRVADAATDSLIYTFTGVSGGTTTSRVVEAYGRLRGADPVHLNDAGLIYRSDAFIPSVNAQALPYTSIAIWGAEFTAGISCVPTSLPAGYTNLLTAQSTGGAIVDNSSTAGSRTGIVVAVRQVESGSLVVPDLTATWTGTPSSVKAASWVVRGLVDVVIVGLPAKLGDGATGYLRFGDGTAPSSVNIWLPGHNDVEAVIARAGVTAAHRGGSADNPEYAEIAYDRAVYKGFDPLEISLGWSADGVPFGLGEQYLDRIAGVSGNVDPTTLPWATIAANYRNVLRPVASGVTQPLYRLEEFLTKYTKTHTVLVDPKFGFNSPAKVAAMLDMCTAIGGPDKVIVKFDSPLADHSFVNAAKSAGFLTMNYWGTDQAKLTPQYGTDRWDLIGVRYDADQAMYDTAAGIGKPVWAAVIPDQAGYDLAAARGADLMMCASVNGIRPVGVA